MKNKSVTIKVTEEQREALKKGAENAGLTLTDFILSKTLDLKPVEITETKEYPLNIKGKNGKVREYTREVITKKTVLKPLSELQDQMKRVSEKLSPSLNQLGDQMKRVSKEISSPVVQLQDQMRIISEELVPYFNHLQEVLSKISLPQEKQVEQTKEKEKDFEELDLFKNGIKKPAGKKERKKKGSNKS